MGYMNIGVYVWHVVSIGLTKGLTPVHLAGVGLEVEKNNRSW